MRPVRRKSVQKNKWTSEEEAALKAGVTKHGHGKWRAILLDPQFRVPLKFRSNVDLKDKWRNISVSAEWGSREKAELASTRTPSAAPTALSVVALPNGDDNGQQIDATPPPPPVTIVISNDVDKQIVEAICHNKSPDGPDVKWILMFVEKNFPPKPDLKRTVTARLKHLTNVGTVLKKKHKYKVSPDYRAPEATETSSQLLLEGNKENSPKPEENLTRSKVDGEKAMTVEEAAEAAAKAVAEAEIAEAEAEEATRKAEEAEAELEASKILGAVAREACKNLVRINEIVDAEAFTSREKAKSY